MIKVYFIMNKIKIYKVVNAVIVLGCIYIYSVVVVFIIIYF